MWTRNIQTHVEQYKVINNCTNSPVNNYLHVEMERLLGTDSNGDTVLQANCETVGNFGYDYSCIQCQLYIATLKRLYI